MLPNMLAGHDDASTKLSHALRKQQELGSKSATLNSYTAKAVLDQQLPRPREQADLLIRWLGENLTGPGELVNVRFSEHGAIIGSKSQRGFKLILDHLFDTKVLTGQKQDSMDEVGKAKITLSFLGWERYEQLRQGNAVYGKAFMAMQYGDDKLDEIVEQIFKPSVKQTGFDLIRLNDVPCAGLIDDRLRVEIQKASFVIADLTHDNHGAYWEAGYAEGLGKPVIYTCEKAKFNEKKTHFDTNHHLHIIWDSSSLATVGESLKATIRATLPHLTKQTDD